MLTPDRDFPEDIGLKDESIEVWTCIGVVHPKWSFKLRVAAICKI